MNTLEGITALQSRVAAELRAASIPEEYVSTILIAIEAGEEARQREGLCPHGYSDRRTCPTCHHFDEIALRERYSIQSAPEGDQ
jgi:hypothetical protein